MITESGARSDGENDIFLWYKGSKTEFKIDDIAETD